MATKIKAHKDKGYYDSIDTISAFTYHKVKETGDLAYLIADGGSYDQSKLLQAWEGINAQIVDYRCKHDEDYLDYWRKKQRYLIGYANAVLKHRPAQIKTYKDKLEELDSGEAATYDAIKNTLQDVKGRHLNDKEITMREWLVMLIQVSKQNNG